MDAHSDSLCEAILGGEGGIKDLGQYSPSMDPNAEGGVPSHLIQSVLKKSGLWVRLSSFQADDAAGAADVYERFSSQDSFSIRASVSEDGVATYRSSLFKKPTETFVSLRFVALNARYAIVPKMGMYETSDEWPYVATFSLHRLGATDEEEASLLKTAQPSERMLARVEEGRLIKKAADGPGVWAFVTVAHALRTLPRLRDSIMAMCCPGKSQDGLPCYSVEGTPEGSKWLTTADVRRVVGDQIPAGDDSEVFKALTKATPDSMRYVKPCFEGLKVTANNHPKDRLSSPFVRADWVEDTFGVRSEDAVYHIPIAFGPHPPNKGTKGRPTRKKFPGVKSPKKTSVKVTLKRRLRDPMARAVIEEIVDHVTRSSRFASHLINLHCIRLLDEGDGKLPRTLELGDTLFKDCIRAAKIGVVPKDPLLKGTLEMFSDALDHGRFGYLQRGNATKYDATSYIGNVKSSFTNHGESRVAGLLKSASRLHPSKDVPKGTVHALVKFVSHVTDVAPKAPTELTLLATKYRTMYAELGLDQGFRVPDGKQQFQKMRSVLELYWNLNRDHVALEAKAVQQGWTLTADAPADMSEEEQAELKVWSRKCFALLPINSFKRRHVRIDNDVFKAHIAQKVLQNKDTKKLGAMSLFVQGGRHRMDVRKLRSRRGPEVNGSWELASSFTTDGTSLIVRFENAERGETPEETKARKDGYRNDDMVQSFGEKDRKVGVDPGRANLMTTCEITSDGRYEIKKLTRDDHYAGCGHDERKSEREARHNRYSEAMGAVSKTRKRTSNAAEFAQYVKAVGMNQADLAKAFGGRSACSEAFRSYQGKNKGLDRFLKDMGTHPAGGKLYVGMGNAKFDSSGPGERSVPTTRIEHRMRTAFKDRMKLLIVDEYNTTKRSCVGPDYNVLGIPYRKNSRDKAYPDRDVRFWSSELALRSHPCPAPANLCAGLTKPAGAEWVCRDGNSAACMVMLMGLSHAERPEAFQRGNDNNPPCTSSVMDGPVQK